MGFDSIKSLVEAIDNGQTCISSFRKIPSQQTAAGTWADFSMAGGSPVTNYYASSPLVAAILDPTKGIYHGPDVYPKTKHLKSIMTFVSAVTIPPASIIFYDSLIYYPFIDGDSIEEQLFDNTVTLPRYADGDKVKAFVVAQGSYVGGARFSITYTNQAGVGGRTSVFNTSNIATYTGTLITSGAGIGGAGRQNEKGPFVTLMDGDTGIRSVESITFETPNSGIFALVLCVPIATTSIREQTAPVEKNFFQDAGGAMPRIYDGAFLGMLVNNGLNMLSTQLTGLIETVWN